MQTSPVLQIQDLTVRYGELTAVNRLSLHLEGGQLFCLLGANGSGKSSTISAIAGLVENYQGTITVAGQCRNSSSEHYQQQIGLVPQDLALYEEMSPRDNLRFFGSFYRLDRKTLARRVDEVLTMVNLRDKANKPVRTLSGGMQRRVNLACALLHQPRLILLDEPTVGLDIASRMCIFTILRQLRDQGKTIILTTHLLQDAEQWCDRFGIMHRGRLLACGNLRQLLSLLEAHEVPSLEHVYLALTEGNRRVKCTSSPFLSGTGPAKTGGYFSPTDREQYCASPSQ